MRMGQGCPYIPGRHNAHQRRGNKGMGPHALGHFHTALPKPAPEMVPSRESSVTLHPATKPQEETQQKSISCWEGTMSGLAEDTQCVCPQSYTVWERMGPAENSSEQSWRQGWKGQHELDEYQACLWAQSPGLYVSAKLGSA